MSSNQTKTIFYKNLCRIIIISMLMVSCSKNEYNSADIVATVNGAPILKSELINRLELTILPNSNKYSERKQRTLNVLVDELLVSQWAEEQEFDKEEDYKSAIGFIKNQALIREFLAQEISDRAEPDSLEIQEATRKTNTELLVRVLYTQNKDIADQWIKSNSNFSKLAEENENNPKVLNKEYRFHWGDGTLPDEIEDVAYTLKSGEQSDIINTNDGYVLLEVKNRYFQMIQSQSDYMNKRHYVRQKLKARNEARLTSEYIDNMLTPLNITQKATGFNELIRYIEDRIGLNDTDTLTHSEQNLEFQIPNEYQLGLPILETPDYTWTGEDVLEVLRDYGFPLNPESDKTLRSSLYRFLKNAIRDQYLTDRAIAAGLESNDHVQRDIRMWSKYYLFVKGTQAMADGDTTNNKNGIIAEKISELRNYAQIEIDQDKLNSLETTNIPMMAFWDNKWIRQLVVPPLKEFK